MPLMIKLNRNIMKVDLCLDNGHFITVIHIGKKDFDAFEIILPDEATLDSFDSITAPMIKQIVNNRLQNKRLAVLRDTLLPKLMSGELDVSDIEL